MKEAQSGSMMFADDIALCGNTTEGEMQLEAWRRELEKRGLKVSRKNTEVHGVQRSERQKRHNARLCAEESYQM